MKKFVSLLFIGVFVVSGVVCIGANIAAEAASGGVLNVVTSLEPRVNNPHWRSDQNLTWYAAVYDTLTRYDENVRPQPHLAESWAWNDDFTQLTMHIRKGVTFHTGRELTAEDIKWNVERAQNPEVGSQLRGSLTKVVEMQLPDTHTIVFSFKQPTLNFFDTLEGFNIMDPETVAETESGARLVGTGPFMVTSWEPGDSLILERNPNYWIPERPLLDGIEISIVPDRDAMVLNLESGMANLVVGPKAQDVVRFQDDDRYQVAISKNEAPRYFALLNTATPPFDNKLVRQAFNWAIPRKRFVDTVVLGLAQATNLPWASVSPAFDAELGSSISLDFDKARALLKEAGVDPEGMPVTITYNANLEDLKKFSVLYQNALSQLGCNVTLDPAEGATYSQRNRGKDFKHILVGNHNNHMLFPTSLLTQNFPWRVGNNTASFLSAEYEQLVANIHTEPDEAKRAALYPQLNQLIIDEAFNLSFSNAVFAWVFDANINGLNYSKFNWMWYENLQIGN